MMIVFLILNYVYSSKILIKNDCFSNLCNKNLSSNFSLIEGLTFPFQSNFSLENKIEIILLSDNYTIFPNQTKNSTIINLLSKSPLKSVFINKEISIFPKKCEKNKDSKNIINNCEYYSTINLKTEEITFNVVKILKFINIIFIGNDLNLHTQNNKSCFYSKENCCKEKKKSFSNKTGECFINKLNITERKNNINYGLFTFINNEKNTNSTLLFQNCKFELINSIKKSKSFFFSLIFNEKLSNNKINNNLKREIIFNKTVINMVYFQNGILYSKANKTSIIINNSLINKYNSFEINETLLSKSSAFYMKFSVFSIYNSIFQENFGLKSGIFLLENFNNVTLYNCSFISNKAKYGAGVFFIEINNNLLIKRSKFIGNYFQVEKNISTCDLFLNKFNSFISILNIFNGRQKNCINFKANINNTINLLKSKFFNKTSENKQFYFISLINNNTIISSKLIIMNLKYFINGKKKIICNFSQIFIFNSRLFTHIILNSIITADKISFKLITFNAILIKIFTNITLKAIYGENVGRLSNWNKGFLVALSNCSINASHIYINKSDSYLGGLFFIEKTSIIEVIYSVVENIKSMFGSYICSEQDYNIIKITLVKIFNSENIWGAIFDINSKYSKCFLENISIVNAKTNDYGVFRSPETKTDLYFKFMSFFNFTAAQYSFGYLYEFNKVFIEKCLVKNFVVSNRVFIYIQYESFLNINQVFFENIINKFEGFLFTYSKCQFVLNKLIFKNIESDLGTLFNGKTQINVKSDYILIQKSSGTLIKLDKNSSIILNNFIAINVGGKDFPFAIIYEYFNFTINNLRVKFAKTDGSLMLINKLNRINVFNAFIEEINVERGGLALIYFNNEFNLTNLIAFNIKVKFGGIFFVIGNKCIIRINKVFGENFYAKESGGVFIFLINFIYLKLIIAFLIILILIVIGEFSFIVLIIISLNF